MNSEQRRYMIRRVENISMDKQRNLTKPKRADYETLYQKEAAKILKETPAVWPTATEINKQKKNVINQITKPNRRIRYSDDIYIMVRPVNAKIIADKMRKIEVNEYTTESEKKYAKQIKKIKLRTAEIIDEIMLGDEKEALIMIKAFMKEQF